MYILDFFGSKGLRGSKKRAASGGSYSALQIPPKRFLTAFGSPDNTFLGYFMDNSSTSSTFAAAGAPQHGKKERQGVIWGKDVRHFKGSEQMLQAAADDVRLVSTSTAQVFQHSNVEWRGHQSAQDWMQLLRQSRFLIGLGNPILGPSAVDAVSVGCMFLNPLFTQPVQVNAFSYASQHPFAAAQIGAPYVCSYQQHDVQALRRCVQLALRTELQPFIPAAMTRSAHLERVKNIFGLSSNS